MVLVDFGDEVMDLNLVGFDTAVQGQGFACWFIDSVGFGIEEFECLCLPCAAPLLDLSTMRCPLLDFEREKERAISFTKRKNNTKFI